MKFPSIGKALPGWQNALLAVAASILLILAFPDWDLWFLAWVALVPLLFAIEREKESTARSFILGWIFGTLFFFGTCWWLTFAPITYAGFPPILAYSLMLLVAALVGIFPALFAAIVSVFLRRYRELGILAVPFVWVFTEILRYWLTGNNWNALGYSQAFTARTPDFSAYGGVMLVSFIVVVVSALTFLWLVRMQRYYLLPIIIGVLIYSTCIYSILRLDSFNGFVPNVFPGHVLDIKPGAGRIVAIQPNVPMSGLTYSAWQELRRRHIRLAEEALIKLKEPPTNDQPVTVVFPESPMNFMYEEDPETQAFINGFAAKHNVSVLFNSAEPDVPKNKYFNSAVMVTPDGKEAAQYDKIYLVPFGEAVPFPLEGILPGLVGNFSYGSEYDLFPVGDAKAGVMICFESHFGQLSRAYVRNGADVLIEMTNDGYLGPTPVLRQHLANAVFRAVETNRPVLRVTNVGITTYINERGVVVDPAPSYQEDTRVWSVSKSDGSRTIYVRYGDWFAWLCSLLTIVLLGYGLLSRRNAEARTQ